MKIVTSIVLWLQLAKCPFADAQESTTPSALRGASGTSDEVQDEALKDFREENLLLPSADTPTQHVSASGTVSVDGKAYSVLYDDLEELSPMIYSEDAKIFVDGEPRPLDDWNRTRTRVFKGEGPSGETVLVGKKDGEVQSVNIFMDGSEFAAMEALADGSLASIRSEDFDMDKLREFTLGDIETEYIETEFIEGEEQDYHVGLSQNDGGRSLQVAGFCTSYKEVELAIAYDSTFCSAVAGNDENVARSVVEQAVARAWALYEPICVRVKVTHLEGFCDPSKDPYVEVVRNAYHIGCSGGGGALQNFQSMWEKSRRDVRRDTAHFFIGKGYPGSVSDEELELYFLVFCIVDNSRVFFLFPFVSSPHRRSLVVLTIDTFHLFADLIPTVSTRCPLRVTSSSGETSFRTSWLTTWVPDTSLTTTALASSSWSHISTVQGMA